MSIQESLFKIAGIFLVAHGMENSMDLVASIQTMSPKQNFEIPIVLYYSKALPILIGVLVWLLSPTIARKMDGVAETISTQSLVSVGTFLLGLYFIGTNLSEIISIYFRYKSLSGSTIGNSFAQDQLTRIYVPGAKLVVGTLLIIFSVKLGKLFLGIRRFGM
jgi:hypothetical protein